MAVVVMSDTDTLDGGKLFRWISTRFVKEHMQAIYFVSSNRIDKEFR